MKTPYHVYRIEQDDSGFVETFMAAFATRIKAMEYAERKAGKGATYQVVQAPTVCGQYRGPLGTYFWSSNDPTPVVP